MINTIDKHLNTSKVNVDHTAFMSWRTNPTAAIVGPMAALFAGGKRPMQAPKAGSSPDKAQRVDSDSEEG